MRKALSLTAEILNRSAPNRLHDLIQLHLSRDCNRPHLARESAENVLRSLSHPCEVHAASQFEPLIIKGQRPETRDQVKKASVGR